MSQKVGENTMNMMRYEEQREKMPVRHPLTLDISKDLISITYMMISFEI